MTDPVRLLLSDDATDFERDLLRSWEDERPAPGAQDRMFAALGLTTAAAGVAAASTSLIPKAGIGWTALLKWLAVGVVAIGATGAGVTISHRRAHEVAPTIPVEVISHAVEQSRTAPTPVAIELDNAPASTAAPRVQSTRPSARPASSLAEQIAELDRARAALDTGDATRALRVVDGYEAAYPGGALTQEAEALRVDALLRAGNRAEAERAGKHFLATYPKSPHASRVRALLGQ